MTKSPIEMLLSRRSVVANNLGEPGPDEKQLAQILMVGARTPDHKKLVPWRFVRFQGEARASFGKILADACQASEDDVGEGRLETEANRFLRAPVVICVVSSVRDIPAVPEWEQILSAGAACQNLLHAANALGFSAQWITEWYAFDRQIHEAIGLGESERIAGFIYIGTAKETPSERDRPDMDRIVTDWNKDHRSA